MDGLDRAQALRNLAALFNRGSLAKATVDLIVEKSRPWPDEAFAAALEGLGSDPHRKQFFPTWAEIRERLPAPPAAGDREADPFNWAQDGTWSGDPMRLRRDSLLMVLGTMYGFARGLPPTLHHRGKESLRELAVGRRGIPPAAIDAAAACWRANEVLDRDWLLAMLEGRAPCVWPRPGSSASQARAAPPHDGHPFED